MGAWGYVRLERLVPIVILAIVMAVGVAVPALRARDLGRVVRSVSRVLLAGAVATIVMATLGQSSSVGGANLVPLRGIMGELGNINSDIGTMNLMGNVAMFVPLGILVPLAFRWSFVRTVAMAAGLAVAIECTQYFLGRSADVDDVLLNTLGAVLGAAVVAICRLVGRRFAPRQSRLTESQ